MVHMPPGKALQPGLSPHHNLSWHRDSPKQGFPRAVTHLLYKCIWSSPYLGALVSLLAWASGFSRVSIRALREMGKAVWPYGSLLSGLCFPRARNADTEWRTPQNCCSLWL